MKFFFKLVRVVVSLFLLALSLSICAATDPLVGGWQSLDEKNGKPSSLITIWREGNRFHGKISKIYSLNGAESAEVCAKCQGGRHNHPILGMTILRNLQAAGKKYKNGVILDPRNGKEYRCVISLSKDKQRLYVRGYLGFSLFGRTAVWTRASQKA